ncbi:MAG: succinate dehydrogenase cytochrome b subunit [Candidatus Omnitrophica bacterium]|nr:succinate dehydrogenase cytochrome b subunit [Candidatus Omnitrophota bacterium]
MCLGLLKTSIGKKQIVAVTGLLLVIFVIGHLIGNLLIFGGPDLFNAYAATLKKARPVVLLIELGLLGIFLTHVLVTILLVIENRKSAGFTRYAVANHRGNISLATQMRTATGLFLFGFVIWHLLDFTLINHEGPRSLMNNQSLGLYGVVYNSFLSPIHSLLYIIAMGCLGFHLAHGVQSLVQTLGFNHPRYTPMVLQFSRFFATLIAIGFSSIPVYVLIRG